MLFVSESQGWSGGAAQLLALAQGLRAAGWDVRLASPADGVVAERAAASGVPHIPFHPNKDYDLFAARRLKRLCAEMGADILHAHHPRAHAVGLASVHMSRRPPVLVVTRRVSFDLPRNPFSRLKYRSGRIAGFIAVAESVRRTLIAGGVSPERVVTIPSGVDTDRVAPCPPDEGLRRDLRLPEGVPVIAKIANFTSWKGQDVFLKGAARLLASGRKAVFLLAGRDTDSPELGRIAREAGLPEGSTRLLGFRDDVPRILSVCSISVNAAVQGEGISGALRESLAMHVPVAAADAGGNAELVRDGETGRLFKAGSAEDLARVLGELLNDPAAAKRLAEAGRRLVEERFSVRRMVARTAEYYESLLGSR